MKKITLFLAVLVLPHFLLYGGGGGFINRNISEDPLQNRLYIGINETGNALFSGSTKVKYNIVNYLLYDIENEKKTFIFPDDNKKSISIILFEIDYDTTNNRMLLNGDMHYSDYKIYAPDFVINNFKIKKREPKDKILFILYNGLNKPREIWICNKNGSNLKKITDIFKTDGWHIDFKNEKLRLIRQAGIQSKILEFDW